MTFVGSLILILGVAALVVGALLIGVRDYYASGITGCGLGVILILTSLFMNREPSEAQIERVVRQKEKEVEAAWEDKYGRAPAVPAGRNRCDPQYRPYKYSITLTYELQPLIAPPSGYEYFFDRPLDIFNEMVVTWYDIDGKVFKPGTGRFMKPPSKLSNQFDARREYDRLHLIAYRKFVGETIRYRFDPEFWDCYATWWK